MIVSINSYLEVAKIYKPSYAEMITFMIHSPPSSKPVYMLNNTTINKTNNVIIYISLSVPGLAIGTLWSPPHIQVIDEPKFEVRVVLDSKSMLDNLSYVVDCLCHKPRDYGHSVVTDFGCYRVH